MSMGAEEAVTIARAFASTRASFYWNDNDVHASEEIVGGMPCWMIQTSETPVDGSDWKDDPVAATITYIVSCDLRRCIGFDLPRGRHMLPDN